MKISKGDQFWMKAYGKIYKHSIWTCVEISSVWIDFIPSETVKAGKDHFTGGHPFAFRLDDRSGSLSWLADDNVQLIPAGHEHHEDRVLTLLELLFEEKDRRGMSSKDAAAMAYKVMFQKMGLEVPDVQAELDRVGRDSGVSDDHMCSDSGLSGQV